MFIFNNFFSKIQLFLFFMLIGEDEYGNRYYEHKTAKTSSGFPKRWCIFKGIPEPSKVPPLFHSWLHYSTNDCSMFIVKPKKFFWQKNHLPNLTGTIYAYTPLKYIKNYKSYYQPWSPPGK